MNNRVYARRKGLRRIYTAQDLPQETLDGILAEPGTVLKETPKIRVRHCGAYIIKETRGALLLRVLKLTFRRSHYRRAWDAALYLHQHGLHVPPPIAYIEHGLAGLVYRTTTITAYLEEHRNVEQFLDALVQRGAGRDTLDTFLAGLARAVNALTETGAYHADLSGKNILTRDGATFYFIDLDAVQLATECTEAQRQKTHVQLYDSFCDRLSDQLLVPFIVAMLPPSIDPRIWMPQIRKAQQRRRRRHERKQTKARRT